MEMNRQIDQQKKGARNDNVSEQLNIPLTLQEAFCNVQKVVWNRFENKQKQSKGLVLCKSKFFNYDYIQKRYFPNVNDTHKFRHFMSIYYRLKLNAFKTKYSTSVSCLCGQNITSTHVLFECPQLKNFLPAFSEDNLNSVFLNDELALRLTAALIISPIGTFL